jgi:hypothetical protein
MRWTRDLSGAAECLEGEFVAGGMGGDYTHPEVACKRRMRKIPTAEVEVKSAAG